MASRTTGRPRLAWLGLGWLGLAMGACNASPPGTDSAPWLESAWPEADRLFQEDRHWVGGDGAYSIDLGGGRVLWLFGDSWIDPSGSGSRRGATMVSNSVAIQTGYDPTRASVEFFWGETDGGEPGPIFPDLPDRRFWPGHGVRLGDRLLLFLMEVRPSEGGLGFALTDWASVLVTNVDAAPPDWEVEWLDTPSNDRGIVVGSGGVLMHDELVYALGSQESGGRHDVFAARWPREEAASGRLASMAWWTGDETGWVSGPGASSRAEPLFTDGQTEFTVHYDTALPGFVELQTHGFGQAVVVRRTAPALTGPWTSPDTVFTPPQVRFPRIMIYQGKAHPHLRGARLVVTYSTNSAEFADHFTEPWLYYPRFARLGGP